MVPQPVGGIKAGTLAGHRYEATRRRLVKEGIRILGAQVNQQAAVGPFRAKLLLTAELWDQAARPVDTLGEQAVLYKEQMDAQMCLSVGVSGRSIKKVARRVGRTWRGQFNVHLRTDSSTLWAFLGQALQLLHPRSATFKSTVKSVWKIMNGRQGGWVV